MTADKAGDATDQTGFTVSGAIDRIRTTAMWLITVFGAVAAAILTGVSFSQVLAVNFGPAILLCIFGVCVSIAGAASAILAAGRVLAARPAKNSEAIDANFIDPVRFFPFNNPAEMKARLIENSKNYKTAQASGNQGLMEAIARESTSLISRLFDWSDVYSVRKLYDEFDRCLEAVRGAVVLVAGGIVAFFLGLYILKSSSGSNTIVTGPVTGIVELNNPASSAYKTLKSCGTTNSTKLLSIPAIVMEVRKSEDLSNKKIEYVTDFVPYFPVNKACIVKKYTYNNTQIRLLLPPETETE